MTPVEHLLDHLEIAGLHFRLRCERPVLFEASDSAYASFACPVDKGLREIPFDVELKDGPLPALSQTREIFQAGRAWSMRTDDAGRRYIIRTSSDRDPAPHWVAVVAEDGRSAVIHCSSRLLRKEDGRCMLANPLRYPLDQILTTLLLAREQGALLHAAGLVVGGRGYLFAGRSGAGKSTVTRLLSGRNEVALLSDDRIVVRASGDGFVMCGTPWPGEMGVARNVAAPLTTVFFLEHAGENSIQPVGPRDALARVLPTASIPWYDPERVPPALGFLEGLLVGVPAVVLRFRPDREAAELVMKFVMSAEAAAS